MKSTVSRELIIQENVNNYEIALLENKELVEFHIDNKSSTLNLSDIYYGRVKKIIPQLNAVFVDIGINKDSFLHFSDLGESFLVFQHFFKNFYSHNTDINNLSNLQKLEKDVNIGDILKVNDYFPVQILKEPISTKGPRLSTELSFAGRFVVLLPFCNFVSISKKIKDKEERQRLFDLVSDIKPNNFGVILRTVTKEVNSISILNDINNLMNKWNEMILNMKNSNLIGKIHTENNKSNTLIRDIFNDSFEKIIVNTKELEFDLMEYIKEISPQKMNIIEYQKEEVNLLEDLGLSRKIKTSFSKNVLLPSGGYLVIEHTEAMHVIDVNSGINTFKKLGNDSEQAILKLNIEAAKEIARQIRLRDLGGLILIDFIDVKNLEHQNIIYQKMIEFMSNDKSNHSILALSKFCVMQITRNRSKPVVNINDTEICYSCNGKGKSENSLNVLERIEIALNNVPKSHKIIKVFLNPLVFYYFKSGFISPMLKLQIKNKMIIRIYKKSSLSLNEFNILDFNGNVI